MPMHWRSARTERARGESRMLVRRHARKIPAQNNGTSMGTRRLVHSGSINVMNLGMLAIGFRSSFQIAGMLVRRKLSMNAKYDWTRRSSDESSCMPTPPQQSATDIPGTTINMRKYSLPCSEYGEKPFSTPWTRKRTSFVPIAADGPRGRLVTYPDFPEIKDSAKIGCKLCPLYLKALEEMFDEEGRPIREEDNWGQRMVSDPWPVPNWDCMVGLGNARFPTSPGKGTNYWTGGFVRPAPPRSDRGEVLGYLRFEIWADAAARMVHWLTDVLGDAAALHGGIRLRLPDQNALSKPNLNLIHGWLDKCTSEHSCCQNKKLPRLPTRVIDVGSSVGRSPRLIETDGRPAHYLTLSHCWGTQTVPDTNLRLLHSNIRSLRREIPTHSISKNFQDAIEVVRKLKFKYLWIDALCIIQDSKSDWENESARMHDVYECSYLTIVATSAETSNDGFLKRPEHSVVTVPYRDDDDPTIVGRFHITRAIAGQHPWDLVDRTTWNTRGWTYQERLLSRRMLHFTSSILFWECRSTDRSEVNTKNRQWQNRPRWILGESRDDQAVLDNGILQIHTHYDRWYMVLRDGETSKALDYWAPSWSWASIAGTVLWPTRSIARHQRDDFTVELLDVQLKVAKENPMGTVHGGYIRMRGRLRLLSCVTKPVEWGAFSRYRFDLWFEDRVIGSGQFDADQDDTAEEVWLLQMKIQQFGDCFFPYHPTALMLERVSGSWMKFTRLGCAVLENEQLDFFNVCELQDFDCY
ncbi:MAG: hypothetical protein Q9209_006983 [Squamulea sp. 1 TL-2023]